MKIDPADLSIDEAATALRSGTLTATVLVAAHLQRIADRNPAIGAFVHVAPEDATAAAQAADTAFAAGQDFGPLHGIPFAIKDIFDVAGWPVRWGSRLQKDRIATSTAPSVQTLLDAGAVPLGLVATYELATVGPDQHSLYAQPRNPWNPAHVTGGSSSGSAAAVASGMVRIALGTDTGGSVRSPASYCGVVGLKPTYGAVSLDGVMPLATALDHVGPIARNVTEAATVFAVLTKSARAELSGVVGTRIAYGRAWCADTAADPALEPLMDEAASVLSLCGAQVSLVELPDYAAVEAAAAQIILAGEYASHGHTIEAQPSDVGPAAAKSILSGKSVTSRQLVAAQKLVGGFGAAVDTLLRDHDVLILPTTMAPAPPFSAFAEGKTVWTAMRTLPFNVTGHPALSVPMGFANGLPMGLQIVGWHGDEATVCRVGAAFEAATDHGAGDPYSA
ncbi:amidase [Falsihalocynthiibacter sp. S25ZX9]|uniref:amidase n=1 Tax=Falsihalocynthiibacter sp. S25ZX9 TaxID=3240870 RepID=UPI00351084F9